MSSNEDDYNDDDNLQSKKRRVQRACDVCRRKKIRCDGVLMPGNRCSTCISYSLECTYVEAAKKRGPSKAQLERLEARLAKLEKVLTRLFPEGDVIKELDSVVDIDAWLLLRKPRSFSSASDPPMRHPCDIATSVIRNVGNEPVEVDDDSNHLLLADDMKRLTLIENVERSRFFGKSSGAMLVHTAIELKNEYAGGGGDADEIRRGILGSIREEFWTLRPWERAREVIPKASFIFPEENLMASLVDLYFTKSNFILPLFHRPSFERSIAEGLHLQDDGFGANVLLVCAVGSRFSDDPRVRLDGEESSHSAGWKWYFQTNQIKKSLKLLTPPTLYDLQFHCLSVMFLQGSSAPQSCWAFIGMGIRMAQDVGAHRRKNSKNTETMTMEDELWKRGFWVLIAMDRMISSTLGRPCAIQDEDFDVDYPIECDDEYWEHPDPSKRFKQPPNKPCYVTAFVLLLKLHQILTIILRTVYSNNRWKIKLGFVGPQWEKHIVAELDSALNKWVDAIPDHLRWDPTREDAMYFDQSATLYCMYYYIQILIHKTFIPSPSKPSPLAFPSLAICTNAARSCSHIADFQRRRGVMAAPPVQIATFTAGVVLLLNIWAGKRAGLSTDPVKEMADVHKCMLALRACESRWHSAARLWDIMYELASLGDLPLPPSPPASNKRDRDAEDSPASSSTTHTSNSPSFTTSETAPRTIAGSHRVHRVQSQPRLHPQVDQQAPLPPPPLSSDELGRFPTGPQPLPSPQVRIQPAADSHQGFPPAFWEALGTSVNATTSTSYSQAGPPAFTFPFPMDLFSNQTGFGFDGSSVQPSTPTTAQALYDPPNFGGAPFQPHAMVSGNGNGNGNGSYSDGTLSSSQTLLDNDTVAMWSNAPSGFELDDWGTYLASVSDLTHEMYQPPMGG